MIPACGLEIVFAPWILAGLAWLVGLVGGWFK